jgi:hypothetical protein
MRPLLLLWVAACTAPREDEPLSPLPMLDPSSGFEAWAATPPPPLSACAGWAALRAGLQYSSVAQAVADAMPGDTVWVCPGVHNEPLEFANPGRYALAGVTGARGDATIDGTGFLLPAVAIWDGVEAQIRDLTFHGTGSEGGIYSNRASAIHVKNIYASNSVAGDSVDIDNTVFARIDDYEFEDGIGRALSVSHRYPFPRSYWPPSEVLINRFFSHNVNAFSGGWVDFEGTESDPSHVNHPYLTVHADDMVFENIHVQRESILEVDGDSYRIEISNLRISDVALTPFTPTSCSYSPIIHQASYWASPRARLELTDFSITDTFSSFLFARYADEVHAPNEFRTILRDGEFLRNTVCEYVFAPSYGTTRVVNVDFGEGADANIGDDFGSPCVPADLGNGETFGQYQDRYYTSTGMQSSFTCWP